MRRISAGLVVVGAAAVTMTGCTAPKKHHFSGFLEDHSKLAPSTADEGALSYQDPDADFTQFKSLYVQPVSVHFANAEDEQSVSRDRLEQYKAWVRDALQDALADYGLDASQQGANVAELRFQVANARLTRAIEASREVHWIREYQMGTANVEAVIVDGSTGAVLAMYVSNTVAPERGVSWTEQEAWASMKSNTRRAIERWVSAWAPKFQARSKKARVSQGEEEAK